MNGHSPEVRSQITTREFPYRLIAKGALKAITDEQGTPLSDWFRDFEVFEEQDDTGTMTVRALIGELGSQKYIIKLPDSDNRRFETVTGGHQEIDYNFEIGAFIASAGSLTYVLDETGANRTVGHHNIFGDGDTVYGKTGANPAEPLFSMLPELPPETQ